jgi:hypothetical protein
MTMNQVRKIVRKVIKKNDDAPGPSKYVQTTTQKKQSDWKWTKTDNKSVIYHFNEKSGICDDLLSKFEAEPPSELFFFF